MSSIWFLRLGLILEFLGALALGAHFVGPHVERFESYLVELLRGGTARIDIFQRLVQRVRTGTYEEPRERAQQRRFLVAAIPEFATPAGIGVAAVSLFGVDVWVAAVGSAVLLVLVWVSDLFEGLAVLALGAIVGWGIRTRRAIMLLALAGGLSLLLLPISIPMHALASLQLSLVARTLLLVVKLSRLVVRLQDTVGFSMVGITGAVLLSSGFAIQLYWTTLRSG